MLPGSMGAIEHRSDAPPEDEAQGAAIEPSIFDPYEDYGMEEEDMAFDANKTPQVSSQSQLLG